jgi:hypothetical protein
MAIREQYVNKVDRIGQDQPSGDALEGITTSTRLNDSGVGADAEHKGQ